MINNYFLLCIFAILFSYVVGTVGHEAIVGGKIASVDQFKYEVSVQVGAHLCGGGLIHFRLIVTAAHCIINNDGQLAPGLTVVTGTNDLHDYTIPSVTLHIDKVYVPREFRGLKHGLMNSTSGDIAVLRLAFTDCSLNHLEVLKVPIADEKYENGEATIAGFGLTEASQSYSDEKLRYAKAKVLTHQEAQEIYYSQVTEKHIYARLKSARNSHHGACIGDQGGPLVHNGTIIGVLSRVAIHCDESRAAGIYTRVSDYLNFLGRVWQERNYFELANRIHVVAL